MELLMPLALLLCFLPVMVFLRSDIRRARAQATIHHISDPAVAHRALIENAHDLSTRPAAIFPAAMASWRSGERNENITTVSYGPHWRTLRCNLTAAILHPSRLASLDPLHQEAARALVADLSARVGRALGDDAAIRIRGPVTTAAFSLATRLCFGDIVDDNQRRALGRIMRDSIVAIGELSPRFDGSMLSKLVNWKRFRRISILMDRQTELSLPLIEARRLPLCGGTVRPYVDSLLDLRVPDEGDAARGGNAGDARRALREGELVGLVFEFLGAASGSVATCVEWTLAHLIKQPAVMNKLRHEIDQELGGGSGKSLRTGMPYLNAVVLESLRMHPPVSFIMRGAHAEGAKAVGATTVPADGLRVTFNLGHIGRDRNTWTDPDEFRPERFLAGGEAEDTGPVPGPKEIKMMPFGAGHRHCPGAGMGMMLIKSFLAALVREFEWAEDCSGGVDMAELDGFLKLMKKPLSAHVTRRT